jgi:predicted alpha/beta superfamily hydrolase
MVTFYFYSTCDDEPGPLLIMHDGQNLFDDKLASYGTSWGLLATMNDPKCPRLRVLGISNAETFTGRIDEYSPIVRTSLKEEGLDQACGGKGDLYTDFIVNDVLPKLHGKYPITEVYLGGSSLGGLITLTTILQFPNQFAGAFGLSNAWWFAEKQILQRISEFEGILPKFYMDIGTQESQDPKVNNAYAASQVKVATALRLKPNHGIKSELIELGKHFEQDWADRLLNVLIWLIE